MELAENKRYYWLKLNESFFEDDTIQWLEEQENGKEYVLFYLKLCLKSLKDDGNLIRYVGQTLIPYDVNALAKLTGTRPDTVAVAMKCFENIGLVEIKDTGEIYLSQINELIGSETDSAKRVRKYRAKKALENNNNSNLLHCNNDVQNSNTEKEIEIDKELEKDIDNNVQSDDSTNVSSGNRKNKISESELKTRFEKLWADYPNKKGKSKALASYKKAIKSGTTDEQIAAGLDGYNKEIAIKGTPKEYIANGSTWFNQERWLDEYDHKPSTPKPNNNFRQEVKPTWLENPQQYKRGPVNDFRTDEDATRRMQEMISSMDN